MIRKTVTSGVLPWLVVLAAGVPVAAADLKVLAFEGQPLFYRVNGAPAGLEYEILSYFARAKGHRLEVVWTTQWQEMLAAVARGEADIAACNITITEERKKLVAFSAPYFPVRGMLVTRKGDDVRNLDQLRASKVVVFPGSTHEEALTSIQGVVPIAGMTVDQALAAVAGGEARATALDSVVALSRLRDFPGLQVTIPVSPEQGLGFAVRKGSPLAAELSDHLQQLKGSGIYYRLLEKYLGEGAVQMIKAGREPGTN